MINVRVTSRCNQKVIEVLREGSHLIEQREPVETPKLEALCTAGLGGIAAIVGGDFKRFHSTIALTAYLTAPGAATIVKVNRE